MAYNNEIVDEVKCVTILEQIRFSIDQDRMFQNSEVKIDVTHNTMLLILLNEQPFDFQEIEYIVNLIDENELFSFQELYNLGGAVRVSNYLTSNMRMMQMNFVCNLIMDMLKKIFTCN